MKQIRIHGPDDVRLDDIDPPDPGSRDVVLQVAACGICGSDVSWVHMGGSAGPSDQPMPIGHELAGVVDWVGADVDDISVGARVIVYPGTGEHGQIGSGGAVGGLTPSLLLRKARMGERVFAVPDGVPLTVAALAEPLGVGMQAVNQADVSPGDKVAVFGCGPVGLMAIATLIDRGIHEVVAIDLSPQRLALAEGLGAQTGLDPTTVDVWESLARLHGTSPFMFGPTPATNAFIEASGSDQVIGDILQHGRVGGRMSVVALHYRPVPINFILLLMKQFTIRGSMEYPPRFEDAIELLERRDLSSLITHQFPLEQFHDGLHLLQGSKDCGKVLITMGVE